jgi:hypothetical protein
MAFLAQLWLPIVISAVLVFVVSAITHMFIPARQTEWGHLHKEADLQEALRGAKPGLYGFPMPADPGHRGKPEALKRWAEGPSGWLSVVPPGPINMGRNLGLSFLLNLLVSAFVAYIAIHALGVAPHYRAVFRMVGSIGFLAYAVGTVYEGIWFWKPWKSLAYNVIDALLYGLVMAGTFGWLWPR